MENVFLNQLKKINAEFISAGTFIHSAGWTHERRINTGFELIVPIKGIINIKVARTNYKLKQGDLLVIPPNTVHEGIAASEDFVQFDWLHTNMAYTQIVKRNLLTQDMLNESGLIIPSYANILNMNRVYIMVNQLLDVYQAKGSKMYLNNLLCSILYEISMQEADIFRQQMAGSEQLQPIKEWIRIHSAENIRLEDIARFFGYNSSYLSRIYRQQMGVTISHEIKNYRIESSKSLLLNTNLTIDEISNSVGYQDSKYYMRAFKAMEQVTPSKFRHAYDRRHMNLK